MRRTVIAALALAGFALPALALAAPAAAGACSGSSGVTVVVQFPDGHTEVGCAAGDPSSGAQALTWAGFSVEPVKGAAFVCKIQGQPSSQTCDRTPPGDAYWAYFHAVPGGSWVYSNTGVYGYNPKPGTVEGFRFGGGEKPSTPPPGSPSAPQPTPKPTPKPTPTSASKPAPASTAKPSSSAASSPGTATGSTAADAAAPSVPSATPTATAAASAGSSPTALATPGMPPTATAAEELVSSVSPPASDDRATAGTGGLPWQWGLVLLAVLGGAGATVTIRRRG